MEDLLKGKSLRVELDEQIVYGELEGNESVIWSLWKSIAKLE